MCLPCLDSVGRYRGQRSASDISHNGTPIISEVIVCVCMCVCMYVCTFDTVCMWTLEDKELVLSFILSQIILRPLGTLTEPAFQPLPAPQPPFLVTGSLTEPGVYGSVGLRAHEFQSSLYLHSSPALEPPVFLAFVWMLEVWIHPYITQQQAPY